MMNSYFNLCPKHVTNSTSPPTYYNTKKKHHRDKQGRKWTRFDYPNKREGLYSWLLPQKNKLGSIHIVYSEEFPRCYLIGNVERNDDDILLLTTSGPYKTLKAAKGAYLLEYEAP